ncbi:uncharacterized protein BDR25DRAFT_356322 [Lindgomyces ingoldianus]|uniref:Uncharacterized protein n=1 Tax=Lindgomyces ingoldianus TaxID=673940 RepID=A0ACB6QRX0_9PLEO|nr:uncharacterized protein BDR25DRAFT_356322 [Lindgomyces ingoldianus]KAF2469592.1 hypothetical protein BDR25DRAFT_356322 [Lindgomyces ingoldianus]
MRIWDDYRMMPALVILCYAARFHRISQRILPVHCGYHGGATRKYMPSRLTERILETHIQHDGVDRYPAVRSRIRENICQCADIPLVCDMRMESYGGMGNDYLIRRCPGNQDPRGQCNVTLLAYGSVKGFFLALQSNVNWKAAQRLFLSNSSSSHPRIPSPSSAVPPPLASASRWMSLYQQFSSSKPIQSMVYCSALRSPLSATGLCEWAPRLSIMTRDPTPLRSDFFKTVNPQRQSTNSLGTEVLIEQSKIAYLEIL